MRFDCVVRGVAIATSALTIGCSGAHAAYEAQKDVAGYHVAFAADPLIIGERNEATVTLTRDGSPVDGALVTLRLSMPQMTMPESVVTLRPKGGGRFAGPVRFTMSGDWLARVAAYRPGDIDVRTQFDFSARDR
jgi:nitrogen fixation protein FixH